MSKNEKETKTTKKAGASAKPATKTAAKKTAAKPAAAKATATKTAKSAPKAAPKPKPASTAKSPAAKKDAPKPTKTVDTKAADLGQGAGDEFDEIIPLVNDKGETVNFYHVATIDYENDWYVFFQPAQKIDDLEEDEVVVFKLDSDEEDNDVFLPIESEELLQKVYAEYVKIMEENGGGDDACGGSCNGCSGCG